MSSNKKQKLNHGFTLVELLVGVAFFVTIVAAVYGAYTSIFNVVYTSRSKIDAIDLINEQLEIIRNMPYASVGITGGIPNGVLTHSQNITRGSSSFVVLTTVRNFDDPFDGTFGGTPNDTSPADMKIVEIEVDCALCKNFKPIVVTTKVAPKNLETASTNGALFVKVFDSNGVPVQNASVHIVNNQVVPAITIDDVTNNQGMLQIVDVPPGSNAYEITVTKAGYSTDKTYDPATYPNTTKSHATVILQQMTQLSFAIDLLSTISVSTVSDTCTPVPSVNFSLVGNKNISISPTVPKYSQNKVTNVSGFLSIPNLEWDTYTLNGIDTIYDFIGINPIFPSTLAPNSTQNVGIIVAPKNPDTLLVTVLDGVTGLPLSGVSVQATTTAGFSSTKITGQGFLGQTDWSGGGGQATSTDLTMYLSSDGNLDMASPVGDVTLKKVLGQYFTSGQMISSSFDTGAPSNFGQIDWKPVDEPLTSNVRFQIATNNDGGTWNFTGPDGTGATYYTNSNKNISAINNGNRYLRYKMFLDTTDTTSTPNISDVSFTFTLSCTPPGQVSFTGLGSASYNLHVSKAGYVPQDVPVTINSAWQSISITMQPI